jgi:hypothetical protein
MLNVLAFLHQQILLMRIQIHPQAWVRDIWRHSTARHQANRYRGWARIYARGCGAFSRSVILLHAEMHAAHWQDNMGLIAQTGVAQPGVPLHDTGWPQRGVVTSRYINISQIRTKCGRFGSHKHSKRMRSLLYFTILLHWWPTKSYHTGTSHFLNFSGACL